MFVNWLVEIIKNEFYLFHAISHNREIPWRNRRQPSRYLNLVLATYKPYRCFLLGLSYVRRFWQCSLGAYLHLSCPNLNNIIYVAIRY